MIDYIRGRLYDVATLPTERNVVLHKYDLEEVLRKPPMRKAIEDEETKDSIVAHSNCSCKAKQTVGCLKCGFGQAMRKQRALMTCRLWDQHFQGNRYVILKEESGRDLNGNDILKRPMDLN